MNSHRVQVFTGDGVFLAKWGSQGDGDGRFNQPRGLGFGPAGNVYVADGTNQRIQVFGPAR